MIQSVQISVAPRFTKGRHFVPLPWASILTSDLSSEEIDCLDSELHDPEAKAWIASSFAPYVYKIGCSLVSWFAARGMLLNGTKREEIISAGFLGLMEALQVAHKRKRCPGDRLSTYLSACVERSMRNFAYCDQLSIAPRTTNRDRIASGKEPIPALVFERLEDEPTGRIYGAWIRNGSPLVKTPELVDTWDTIEVCCRSLGKDGAVSWELMKRIGDHGYLGDWHPMKKAAAEIGIPLSKAYRLRARVREQFDARERKLLDRDQSLTPGNRTLVNAHGEELAKIFQILENLPADSPFYTVEPVRRAG